jgi:hypothetical protein
MFGMGFFILMLCLSGCDNFNQSIKDFIDDQTSTVVLRDVSPAAEEGVIRIPPATAEAPEFVLTLNLRNARGYALDVAVLTNDGTKPDPAVVRAEPGDSDQVFIRIAGARPGDAFNLTLKLRKADGTRSFADIELPPVMCQGADIPSTDKAITAFSITGPVTADGAIDETAEPKTVTAAVPGGTIVTSMTVSITHTGVSVAPANGTARNVSPAVFEDVDFTGPVTFTVTAADGTSAAYVVTVTVSVAPEPVYSVVVTPAANGTVTASPSSAAGGDVVVLTVHPAPGHGLKAGTLQVAETAGGAAVAVSGPGPYTFVMPAADVTVTAEFALFASFTAQRGTTYYAFLKDAINAAPSGSPPSPDEITLLQSIPLPEGAETTGYTIDKHIRLTSGDGAHTVTRKNGFTGGSLFTVVSGASLTLDGSSHALVIDGNGITASAPLMTVSGGGTLTMHDGVVLRNNENTGSGGAVQVTGPGSTCAMSGGTISGNNASYGGAVYVTNGGTFTMTAGSITGNDAVNNGGGVYARYGGIFSMSGTAEITGNNASNGGAVLVSDDSFFTMTAGSAITENNATNGGGVYVTNGGTFTMIAGSITGNSAAGSGGGVCIVGASSQFEMQGGTIGGSGPGEANTAGSGDTYGHAVYYNVPPGYYYRDAALNAGDSISTGSALPAVSGDTLNNWTKR